MHAAKGNQEEIKEGSTTTELNLVHELEREEDKQARGIMQVRSMSPSSKFRGKSCERPNL